MLRRRLSTAEVFPFVGVYDAFSAAIASRHFEGLFVSGFSFSASFYGLPDIGLIGWPDIVAYVRRLRALLPRALLLVDLDDGYADVEVACHVTRLLEQAGAAGLVLEDQDRPKRCGHLGGKRILDLETHLERLRGVLAARRDLFVVARTDASDRAEVLRRVRAFAAEGADAVLVDGLSDLDFLREIAGSVPCPVVLNVVPGGKMQPVTMQDAARAGVRIMFQSTTCLFAAHSALEEAVLTLKESAFAHGGSTSTLALCHQLLLSNHDLSRGGTG
jgi:2-methylisocitrate lyase-like PEP mutase family enzyme